MALSRYHCLAVRPHYLAQSLARHTAGVAFFLAFTAQGEVAEPLRVGELTQLGFEQLLEIQVTSVSRKAEPWFSAPAAVYVVTQDEIKRSGARNLAELLRSIPGVNVAQIDGSKWAVSARGFNHLYAHNLLVLVDGRSVYSPLHAGVHWDTIDGVLDDIDRIEVIRGPGATLWGANAVNGVINIVSKKSSVTQGRHVMTTVGNQEFAVELRHGGAVGKEGTYRVFTKYSDNGNNAQRQDGEAPGQDDWRTKRAGFRADWRQGTAHMFTFQSDYYSGVHGETLSYPDLSVPFTFRRKEGQDLKVSGFSMMGQWNHRSHTDSEFMVQLYYDQTQRIESPFEETHDSVDLDFQHRQRISAKHLLIWGGGYRRIWDLTRPSFRYGFVNTERTVNQMSVFAQDEITVTENITVTAGTKFEHYNYTGWETQPNLRVAWAVNTRQALWGAVSRAVRTPSRNDDDVAINVTAFPQGDGTPAVVRILGNPEIESEKVTTYELGYRLRPTPGLVLDLSLFHSEYEDLIGTQAATPFFEPEPNPAHLVLPRFFVNDTEGQVRGAEFASTWQVSRVVRLNLGYSYLDMDITAPDGFDVTGNSPRHQAATRVWYDLSSRVILDVAVYYVDELWVQNRTSQVPAYARTDLRIAWHPPVSGIEIAAGVRNAFDRQHPEFGSVPFIVASEIDRTYYVSMMLKF